MAVSKTTDPPVFFATAAEFGDWLAHHATTATSLTVGFWKVGSGQPSMTWPESVDEALCHGWIDGVRKRIDDASYLIRFTPRKATSIWSSVNIARMEVLGAEGRVTEAGHAAFARRAEHRSSIYAYEQADAAAFTAAETKEFRRQRAAWRFFEATPPWYRKTIVYRVTSAKRPETRAKRLRTLIEACAEERRLR